MNNDLTSLVCNHDENHQNHQAGHHDCSPLCVCSVCGQVWETTQLSFPIFRKQPNDVQFSEQKHLAFVQELSSQFLMSIFQPPRV